MVAFHYRAYVQHLEQQGILELQAIVVCLYVSLAIMSWS